MGQKKYQELNGTMILAATMEQILINAEQQKRR
jgi:hypothetical protein